MAEPFNPSDPCGSGNEWRVNREASLSLGSDSSMVTQRLRSSNTRDIDRVDVFLPVAQAFGGDDPSGWELEVYPEASFPGSSALAASIFRPSVDVRNFNAFAWGPFAPTGTQVDVFRGVNNAALTQALWPNSVPLDPQPVDDDRFIYPTFGTGYDVAFKAAGIAGTFDGKRITRVSIYARVAEYIWSRLITNMGVRPYLMVNGQRNFGQTHTVQAGFHQGFVIRDDWTYNPLTRVSWKPADLAFLDDTSADPFSGFGYLVAPTGSANNLSTLLQCWIEVEITGDATDPRIVTGWMSGGTPDGVHVPPKVGWNQLVVAKPDGSGDPWAKLADTPYVITMRRTSGKGTVSWRLLAADGEKAPHVWDNAFAQVTSPSRLPAEYRILEGDQHIGVMYAVILQGVDDSLDPDSQPYASSDGDLQPSIGVDYDWCPVSASHVIQQDFTPGDTTGFGFIRVEARLQQLSTDGDLTVKIKTRAGDVQQGGTLVFTQADVGVDGTPVNVYQTLEGELSGVEPTLTSGTQYYVEFTSTATDGQGWRVQVLSTHLVTDQNGPPAGVGDVTFGGSTDRAHIDGVPHDELDAAVTVYTVPDGPADFAVIEDGVDPLVWALLTWTPTDVGAEGCGAFVRYEIDRSDDEVLWQRIANITTEAVDEFLDVECRRAGAVDIAPQHYRIRVRRADHATSNWSATETVDVLSDACGYWFGSNERPALLRFAEDIGPTRTDGFVENTVTQRFYARNYAVTFAGIEFDGITMQRTLLLAAIGGHTTQPAVHPGQQVWLSFMEAVRPNLGATLSYVAVCSNDGDRWLSAVTLRDSAGVRSEPDGSYELDVIIKEATSTPSIVDAQP